MNNVKLANTTLHLIGCGKMGSSLLNGWLRGGTQVSNVSVSDPYPSEWVQSLVADGLTLNPEQVPLSDVVIIATKPQLIESLGEVLSKFDKSKTLFLSIAAGTTIETLSELCGTGSAIVRAMPNIPASIGEGVTGFVANANVSPEAINLADTLLSAVGEVVKLDDEEQMHALTAVSGSGPAYVFALAEAMTNAGVEAGLSAEASQKLAIYTIKGASLLMAEPNANPSDLRVMVTSPNGTTQAGLDVLTDEATGLPPLISKTIAAARSRSVELSQGK